MNKMMNPEMEVVRFGAEDIMTASGEFLFARATSVFSGAGTSAKQGTLTFWYGPDNAAASDTVDIGLKFATNKFTYVGETGTAGEWTQAEDGKLAEWVDGYSYTDGNGVAQWLNDYKNTSRDLVDGFTYKFADNLWTLVN